MDSCSSSPSSPHPSCREATPSTDASPSSSSFQCCVCLDLLCKPVVLSCGHISCFWCVQKSMHGLRASHCVVCRNRYHHFPSICWLLHHLVWKIEPVEYERRQKELLEEEQRTGLFSSQAAYFSPSQKVHVGEFMNLVGSRNEGHIFEEDGVQNGTPQKVAMTDLLCAGCKELLFQPAVFNCGHVYCESCMSHQVNGSLKCQVCQNQHPGDCPNVCLELDHFLQEEFPKEYAIRQEKFKVEILEVQSGNPSSSALETWKRSPAHAKDGGLSSDDFSDAHVGIGCDSCGMYPIIGKRYKCRDCKEKAGFDLCESCYNSSSKLPGRFNQKHKPDHEFKLDNSKLLRRLLALTSLFSDDPYQDTD